MNGKKDVLYTTKIDPQALGYEATKKVLKESLEKAKSIGYIDLVLIHAPRGDTEKRLGSWKALEEAVQSGDVKDIGVSNYEIEHLQELLENPNLKIKPSINQLEVQPWFTREKLIAFNKKAGIEVEAYSPLTRGKKLDDKELVELGKKYGKSPAQILIRWSIDKGYIPLPRTTKEKRLEDNFDVFDFKLSEGDIKVLDGKDENLRSRDI
ncbi:DEKNAAC101535 [Brettanomyces naardenensis]|uniref:DEKNAAC101535 n=1 Tax=Brettanomyces naardenensis TaxID=13370 RepID=A0A448YII5_BRENA|nr:DEKNAAC101535 [Brettanomyces naardenensis]